jgi:hypothetical protein
MTTLTPLFDLGELDLPTIEQLQPAPEQTPEASVFARPEDALGRVSIALIGEGVDGLAEVLRERAIAEGLIVDTSTQRAADVLAERRARALDTHAHRILFPKKVTREVEQLVPARSFGVTVVLVLDSLNDIEDWSPWAKGALVVFDASPLVLEAA